MPPQPLLTNVSEIAATLHLHCLPDVTNHFIVRRLLEGCCRRNAWRDQWRPITIDILHRIVPALNSVCFNHFQAKLFRVAFLLAFYGFLQIGKNTAPSVKVVLCLHMTGNQFSVHIII